MNIKTITTTDGVNTVDFGSAASRFYWFQNIGTTTVYVSGNSDISAGVDGVAELPSGGSVCIETLGGKVYILGEGKVQIHNTGDKFCPFKLAPVSDGGGVTVCNDNLLINPDFKINQRGKLGTIVPNKNADGEDIHTYFVDRWGIDSGSVTINADGTLTLNGTMSQILENAVGANVTASVSAGTAVYDDTTKTFTITGNGDVISWAKLEIGCAATAFIPPDPATELMKCRRYYRTLNRGTTAYSCNAMSVVFVLPFDTPMRNVMPSFSILNTARLCWSGGWLGTPEKSALSILTDNINHLGICYIQVSGFNVTSNGNAFPENYSFRLGSDNFIGIDAEIY